MRCEYPVTFFEFCNLFPNLDYLAGQFMAENERCFLNAIPFENIAATYAACHDFNEDIPFADVRNRQLLHVDSAVVIIHSHTHAYVLSSLSSLGPILLRHKEIISCFRLFSFVDDLSYRLDHGNG